MYVCVRLHNYWNRHRTPFYNECHQQNSFFRSLRCGFVKWRLTNTPRRHRLADGQLSSLYAPPPSSSSFGAASVMMCCSARPASSSTPLRPCVLPEDRIGLKYNIHSYILWSYNVFHIFDQTSIVLKSSWSSTLRSNPRRHRQVVDQLSPTYPLAQLQLVWRRLCEALRSSSSLAGQKHPSLLSRLVWTVGNIYFVFQWTWRLNGLLYLRTPWMPWQRRSQFEHDHRRRADREPQITASFTWDRRRAHWHI